MSIKTVSRVVNGESGISARTTARVRRGIDQPGFQRHAGASILRSGRSRSIGFVTRDLADVVDPPARLVVRASGRLRTADARRP